ncbi:MAG: ADP-glyceromanno-heptose 6-epimerase [Puniceicoccaceae bacterium]|nr:MAG: ADP-glyceromanno-heptose 6-epimerase [Puniceicoccaceae bacterium]
MKQQRILVTGGAGFIGSALVNALNELGEDEIIIADQLGQDDKWKNLVPLRYADYIDAGDLIEQVRQDRMRLSAFSKVFHLGACSATTERDASYLMENNYAYTKDLANAAIRADARFVYASSAATYGDGSLGMDDTLEDLSKLRPLNMYGYSKHLFDCYAQRNGLLSQIVGLKYFNVFGPNEEHKGDMRSLVSKAYQQILDTGTIKLFKSEHPEYRDGEQKRDFLYVKDAVAMTIHLSENREASGLFNLGSGQANTWLALANAIFEALGREPDIRFIDLPEVLRGKYQYYTCADITKLVKSGFRRRVPSLETSVKDYVQNYLVPGKCLGE